MIETSIIDRPGDIEVVDIRSGSVSSFAFVREFRYSEGRKSIRGFRASELTKSGVPDKRHRGQPLGVRPGYNGQLEGRAAFYSAQIESSAAPIREEIARLEAALEAANHNLRALYL